MGCLSPIQVNESFIANAPLMSATIKNLTLQAPSWFRDQLNPTPWPEGEGNIMQEHVFRGELPMTEEGFDQWGTVDDPSGCEAACAPNCSYNMTVLGGHSWSTRIVKPITRDFRSPDYCVKTIASTRQFQEVFSAIVANMYNQIDFQKEVNVGQNFMTTKLAKKVFIDGSGFVSNSQDPWSYRPKGTATLGAINIAAFRRLYEVISGRPGIIPFAYQNGQPMFAAVASSELLSSLYTMDPTARGDIRAVGGDYAKKLIESYNFTESIQGMFLPVFYKHPRRFRYDNTNSVWIRVLPWVKGVPGQLGTYTDVNPLYEDPSYATHEEILIHGRDPFSTYYKTVPTTIGEGTEFGPEPGNGFWDNFNWINPITREDPAGREGFFFTTAEIALSADNSEGVIGWLVPRPPSSSIIAYYPGGPAVPPTVAVTNTVPAVGCPVSMIVSGPTAHPITAGTYFVVFEAPVAAVVNDIIQLGHSNGGYVNATVAVVSADSRTFQVTIAGTLPICDRWISVYTGDSLGCSSVVVGYSVDLADATRLDLVLDRPTKADLANDAVTLFYGNGTSQTATVIGTPNMLNNTVKVDIGASAFVNNVGGIVSICVPTATDASCPACSAALTSETVCT